MCVSSVEVFNFLKKSLGIIIKKMESEGVLSTPSFSEHRFIPNINVDDRGVALDVSGLLYKVGVPADAPSAVYLNIDRPVTDYEYKVIFPGMNYVVLRRASKIYLKAPTGFSTRVGVEVLT